MSDYYFTYCHIEPPNEAKSWQLVSNPVNPCLHCYGLWMSTQFWKLFLLCSTRWAWFEEVGGN